ncbi:MAG: aminotransferase class I/II-fold pyridoxal phosphate-dependent enzyme [Actinobacteria bacterium]|nr:aminotransferase class I/II-fold pyridoxal phosphate-dependent enzyme [Actinomycetota bacterium]
MPMSRVASRLRPFGATVFAEITERATATGAINLGQGYPNFDGPDFVKEAAVSAIRAGHGQYAPTNGIPRLAELIADRYPTLGSLDSASWVTVTSGCTEALAATFLGLLEPGDEVILIEPTYDAYPAGVALAGAIPRFLTLRPPKFDLDLDRLESLVTTATKAIVINTPHNPAGKVFSRDELETVADLCHRHNLVAICDEVYEHMVYDGEHLSLATFPEMSERTVTLSSLGKTFSLTGWKIGWAVAPPPLTAAVRAAHQFLTFATATPLQHGAVAALAAPPSYYTELTESYRRKRDLLATGLSEIGFDVFLPAGTYFLMADHASFGSKDDVSFVKRLIDDFGVAAIPPSAFYHDPAEARSLVRFAFCKDEVTLAEAIARMGPLRSLAS